MIKSANIIINVLLFVFLNSCKKANDIIYEKDDFIKAVDISQFEEIATSNPFFFDLNNIQKEFLDILKENGVNTIRLKLWINPSNIYSSFNNVKQFSEKIKNKGFKTWLTVHYSDTWADPGNQKTPNVWKGLSFSHLRDSVYEYTKKVVKEMNPNYIQIGNEINSGILHPLGNIVTNKQNFIELIKTGCQAVRQTSKNSKIILHFAGIENSSWFFDQMSLIDYDIIGLSFYPIWHGKSLQELKQKIDELSSTHNKNIVIAETAYPFTLGWNDWTNNIVGLQDQLILPDFPATTTGQKSFVGEIKKIVRSNQLGLGFCYWGAELISWKGTLSTNGSSWENQAIFDFSNKALPVLLEFKNE